MSSVPYGPAFVSAYARALWSELKKPAAQLDRAEIHYLATHYSWLLEIAVDGDGLWFGCDTHEKKPDVVRFGRPACWHEVPAEVAAAVTDPANDDWRATAVQLVAKYDAELTKRLDVELARAEKRPKRPKPLRAVELLFEGATDVEAAEELGISDRALRDSPAWRRLREALAADELRKRR